MKIYNVIAEMCSYIIQSCDSDFFEKYSCISVKEKNRIDRLLREKCIELFDGDSVRVLNEEFFHEDFYKELGALICELKEKQDYNGIVGLLQCLDEGLAQIVKSEIAYFQRESFSVVLNTNREEVGLGLLPRCTCNWERKKRLSHIYNRMDNFLYNFLLMENSILGELIDKHIFLKEDLFEGFKGKNYLTVAATPLKNTTDFTMSMLEREQVNYFDIAYDEQKAVADNELIWTKIMEASAHDTDILVFPEMLGNTEMVSYITARLKVLPVARTKQMPSLIVLPSVWKNRKNQVTVVDKYGNVICVQGKQKPFRMELDGNGCLENIYQNQVVNILHYEGIGRIAVMICKDFLTTRYLEQLIRCFKVTLIIVPSFSTGSYDFRQSFNLCAHDDCNVIWINSCAAMLPGKEANFKYIGYVRKRISRQDDESQELCDMKSCPQVMQGKPCDKSCLYYEVVRGV